MGWGGGVSRVVDFYCVTLPCAISGPGKVGQPEDNDGRETGLQGLV